MLTDEILKARLEKIREALDLLSYFNDAGNLTDDEEQVLVRADNALKLEHPVPAAAWAVWLPIARIATDERYWL
jgi:hypothetical protein